MTFRVQSALVATVVLCGSLCAWAFSWSGSPASFAAPRAAPVFEVSSTASQPAASDGRDVRDEIETEQIEVPLELARSRSPLALDRATVRGSIEDELGRPFTEPWTMRYSNTDEVHGSREFAAGNEQFALDLGSGCWTLAASAIGLASRTATIEVNEQGDSCTVRLRLEATGNLEGLILTEDGTPLAGLSLVLESSADASLVTAITRANGTFTLSGLLDGQYVLHHGEPASAAFPPREIEFRGPRQVLSTTTAPMLFELEVRVVDSSGSPVEDARITGTGSRGGCVRGRTDASGSYRAPFLPSGRYRIVASQPAIGRAETRVVVQTLSDTPTTLVLRR